MVLLALQQRLLADLEEPNVQDSLEGMPGVGGG
jgi:hypothetical protein